MQWIKTLALIGALLILLPVQACAQSHSVTLTWTASIDAGVTYNIYRAAGACPATGVPGTVTEVGSGITALTYKDASVTAGTWCYYATASLNGSESNPSNAVTAVVKPGAPTALTITGTQ